MQAYTVNGQKTLYKTYLNKCQFCSLGFSKYIYKDHRQLQLREKVKVAMKRTLIVGYFLPYSPLGKPRPLSDCCYIRQTSSALCVANAVTALPAEMLSNF